MDGRWTKTCTTPSPGKTLIQTFVFEGCNWRPIPAHPRWELLWDIWICELQSFWLLCLAAHIIFPVNFNHFVLNHIFCLQRMQLTTDSSAPQYVDWHEYYSTYCKKCYKNRNINRLCKATIRSRKKWTRLQGMQLTNNSSAPRYVEWHNNGIVEFVSSRAFVWYAKLHILLSDGFFITDMGKDLIQLIVGFFLALIGPTALVAKWFRRIFDPPVQSRCSRYPTNNTKITSKERS